MMQWIVSSSLRLRAMVVVVAALLLAGGAWKLRETPLDVVPEFSPLTLQVQTEALGLSAAEVESLITVPMEADLLNGLPWLKSIQSESITGLSSIEMFFEPGTDIMHARQMVQERLTQAHALPNVSKPPLLLQPVSSASRIMNIGLTSKTVPLIDISVQAQWNIMPKLSGVPGVANISIWGQRDRQLQVLVDPRRLRENDVSLDAVIKTAGEAVWASPLTYLNSSTPGSGGFIDTPNQRLVVRHVSPITSAQHFTKIPIFGTPRPLGDVADIVEAHQPLIGDAIMKNGTGLMLVIEKFPNFNTADVTRGVEAALDTLRPGLTGVDIDTTIYRPASFIERATSNLSTAIITSGILAIIAFCALLGSWRAALIGLVSMAVSLVAAILVLQVRGINLNMMVIAGLLVAVAAIIDDAITDVTNINRRLRENQASASGPATWTTITRAAIETRGPMLYATIIMAVAVLPILFMAGLSGAFFRPLVLSYLAAIVVSFLVAMIVTPALSMLLLSDAAPAGQSGSVLIRGLQNLYDRVAQPGMKSMVPAGVLVAAGLLAAGLVWTQRDRSMIPTFKETDVFIEWQAAPGTSLQAMNRTTTTLLQELQAVPGVLNAAAHIGRAQLARDISDVNGGEVWVSINPRADYDKTLEALEQIVQAYPGVHGRVETYLSKKMRESLTGEEETVTVRVYGHDLSILRGKAEEIRAAIARIPGIANPRVEQQAERSAVEVEVDLDRAREHGLKPGDVRRAASTLISGITVGALFEDQKVFDVVVWGAPQIRNNLHDIENLQIDIEGGQLVRLADVANVRIAPANNAIRRHGASRRIDIDAEVVGRPLSVVTHDVARRVADIAFPFEYHARVLGVNVERQTALNSLYAYFVAAAVIIFLLLQAAFGSWRLAFLSLLGIPAALLGSFAAMYLIGDVTLLGLILGSITVLGLAVRNDILLVKRFQILEHRDGERPERVVARGMAESFQPVITTAITTALVVLPFVVFGDVAGLEILHPASVVILAGLVTSTLLTLFVVPALYLKYGVSADVDRLALTPEVAPGN